MQAHLLAGQNLEQAGMTKNKWWQRTNDDKEQTMTKNKRPQLLMHGAEQENQIAVFTSMIVKLWGRMRECAWDMEMLLATYYNLTLLGPQQG